MLFEKSDLTEQRFLQIEGERAKHLIDIQHVLPGDFLRVGELGGPLGTAVVTEVRDSTVLLQLDKLDKLSEAPWVDLILALPRPQTLKKVLQTCATIGVRRLMLISSARVEKSYFSSPLLKPENISYYLRLGLEQGVSTCLPEVSIHRKFVSFIEQELDLCSKGACPRLLPHPKAAAPLVALGRTFNLTLACHPLLAFGPEGGWLEYEVQAFEDLGFKTFHCGARIMRVETAVSYILGQIELLRSISSQNHG